MIKNLKLMILAIAVIMSGCSSDESESEKSVSEMLMGKWNVVKDGDRTYDEICSYFIFLEESKLTFKNCHSYSGETNLMGQYELVNDNHILFIDYNYFLDDAEADIISITPSNLKLKFSNATNYTRIMELKKEN